MSEPWLSADDMSVGQSMRAGIRRAAQDNELNGPGCWKIAPGFTGSFAPDRKQLLESTTA